MYGRYSSRQAGGTNVPGLMLCLLLVALCIGGGGVAHGEEDALGIDIDRRYDQNTYLTAHNSFASHHGWDYWAATSNQISSVKQQLDAGVRALALDVWLMRERWKKSTLSFEAEIYEGRGAYLSPSESFEDKSPNLVLAHEPKKAIGGYTLIDNDFTLEQHGFEPLWHFLEDVGEWMREHPNAVVTLVLESYVSEPGSVESHFEFADVKDLVFRPHRSNPGLTGPDGKDWNVKRHGWPTLRQMIDGGKRLVVFSGNGTKYNHVPHTPVPVPHPDGDDPQDDGQANQWLFMVENVYGDESVTSGKAHLRRGTSSYLADLAYPLASMNYFPDANLVGADYDGTHFPSQYLWNMSDLNSFTRLTSFVSSFATVAQRYPNYIWVDHYHKGDGGGPKKVVQACNAYWAGRPVPLAWFGVQPSSSKRQKGTQIFWTKDKQTTVTINGFDGSDGVAHHLKYHYYGGSLLPQGRITQREEKTSSVHGTANVVFEMLPVGFDREGVFYFSGEAITSRGDRSKRALLTLGIDSTAPVVGPITPVRQPDHNGWYNRDVDIVITSYDPVSGTREAGYVAPTGSAETISNLVLTQEPIPDPNTPKTNAYIQEYQPNGHTRTFRVPFGYEGNFFQGIKFFSRDFAGNDSRDPLRAGDLLALKLDKTPPTTKTRFATNQATQVRTLILTASDNVLGSGVEKTYYHSDGGPVQSGSYAAADSISIVLSNTQAQVVYFWSEDVAGNAEAVRSSSSLEVQVGGISLSSNLNPSVYADIVTFTAQVLGTDGIVPTGTVTFFADAQTLRMETLDDTGTAALLWNFLGEGTHAVTARYNPASDSRYKLQTSAALTQVVHPMTPVSLIASSSSSVRTQPVTFTATAEKEPDEPVPTGFMTFQANHITNGRTVSLGPVLLDGNGAAAGRVTELSTGTWIISVDYSGDTHYHRGHGGILYHEVGAFQVGVDVTTSPNPSQRDQPVTLAASVTPPPGVTLPAGSVRFDDRDTFLGEVPVDDDGVAQLTVSSLAPGSHLIIATFNSNVALSGGVGAAEHMTLGGVQNVTGQVSMARGGLRYNRTTQRWLQTVTVTNAGSADIPGPLALVLDSLTSGVTLANQSGVTAATRPQGSPYREEMVAALAPGASVMFMLAFDRVGTAPISYTPGVLAGPGDR